MIDNTAFWGQISTNLLNYCTVSPRFSTHFPSENPVLTAPICTSFASAFYMATSACPYSTVTIQSNAAVTDLSNLCGNYNSADGVRSITLEIADLSRCTAYSTLISNNRKCSAILGTPLDFTSVTSAINSVWGRNTTNYASGEAMFVRYKPNTLHVNHNIAGERTLSTDSLISIANGLRSGSNTITLYTDIKALCPAIMGTVSQVTEDDVTYDFFTADASGSVTLENFITQTKGWTIA